MLAAKFSSSSLPCSFGISRSIKIGLITVAFVFPAASSLRLFSLHTGKIPTCPSSTPRLPAHSLAAPQKTARSSRPAARHPCPASARPHSSVTDSTKSSPANKRSPCSAHPASCRSPQVAARADDVPPPRSPPLQASCAPCPRLRAAGPSRTQSPNESKPPENHTASSACFTAASTASLSAPVAPPLSPG